MSEHVFNQFRSDLTVMNDRAKLAVIFIGGLIHLFLNIYTFAYGTPFLKVEVPVLSTLTILVMIISGKYFDKRSH